VMRITGKNDARLAGHSRQTSMQLSTHNL
jgi:hypothetical protein